MTTEVMVVVNGVSYEAHIYVERRDQHGHFVRDEHPQRVQGREHGQGFGRVYMPDNGQLVISEHPVRHMGDAPGVDRENDGA